MILSVASQSFMENGYAGTSMSSIAAELGGSKGTLWNYFPSKEDLFEAVMEEKTRNFKAEMIEILNPTKHVEETLNCYATNLLRKVTSPEAVALHRLAVGEASRFPEMSRIFFERGPRLAINLLTEYISGAMSRGQLRQDNPKTAALTLNSMIVHTFQIQFVLGLIDTLPEAQLISEARNSVCNFMRIYGPDISV